MKIKLSTVLVKKKNSYPEATLLFYRCSSSFKEMLKSCVIFITEYIPIKDTTLENTEEIFFYSKENKGYIECKDHFQVQSCIC